MIFLNEKKNKSKENKELINFTINNLIRIIILKIHIQLSNKRNIGIHRSQLFFKTNKRFQNRNCGIFLLKTLII